MSAKLIAFHGSPEVKAEYTARIAAHAEADDLIRGTFGSPSQDGFKAESGWRGCAVGCTFHDNVDPHGAAETQIGVPRILARLEDKLFESVSAERYKTWPGQFLAAIAVGADLSNVWPQLAMWLLVDEADGVIRFAKTDSQREAIQRVADLYKQKLAGEEVAVSDWRAARQAAAADAAAYAAAYAAYAAYAAAYAADAAADAAAYAAYAAKAAADRRSYFDRMADKLLELLAAAPIAEVVV